MRFIDNHKIGWILHVFVFGVFWIAIHYTTALIYPPVWAALVTTVAILFSAAIYTVSRIALRQIEKEQSKILWIGGTLLAVFLLTIFRRNATIYFSEHLPLAPISPLTLIQNPTLYIPLIVSVIPVGMAYTYHGISSQSKKEKRNMALLHEYQESQIQYLKAQINPHFLFNTLHNIYSLSVVKSPQTPEMVLRLSDLLRYAIYDGAKNLVPVHKELEQCQKLIELFQMRSRNATRISLKIEGKDTGMQIEPMLFIPLVENAIKHGDIGHHPEGFAHFEMQYLEKGLRFKATNSFSPNPQKDKVGGVGLANIQKRLSILHPGKHQMEISDAESVFTVIVAIEHED